MERQGEQPQVNHFNTHEEEVEAIRTLCTQFTDSKHHSLGIICKTQKQADELFKDLTPNPLSRGEGDSTLANFSYKKGQTL